ncbi:MAG: acetyl-CoA carboxylase biotin carboxylase subunit [Geobacteraceae bacterium]
MFSKILIANRSEIAIRVMRTCREMGIGTVAVYSDADKESLHVKYADEAVNIGPPLSRKSYLNMEKIIDAAKAAGVQAIHPGYGFLSENASFALACEENRIKFIGPTAKTHLLTGEKIAALKIAAQAGIPVTPGSKGVLASAEEAVRLADEVGYPVILKASGGGGGRGMKIARNKEEVAEMFATARGEAVAAFNNPDIYLEKYLVKPRHIEFQILADEYGNCIHLGERECSIQKRYQKLVEETPSPFMDENLREEMGMAAIRVMKSVGYVNAGTVEFLVDSDRNFYFNEINSRLQVEHPVTEMVTGIDLVRQQILIAAGGKLEINQHEVKQFGSSIECRINAEDPENNFMPRPGVISGMSLPGGMGVRVDTHLYNGYEIPPFYDSLIAKLIVWGEDRCQAIRRMERALGEFHLEGIKTTIPFHKKVMRDEEFVKGNFDTHFLEKYL